VAGNGVSHCAIVGVGETRFVRGSGVSTLRLGAECAINAIRDAGLEPQDIDGMILFTYMDPLSTYDVANALGITLSWQLDVAGGGNNATGIITTAAAAIQAGLCKNVVCLHAINRFSARPDRARGPNLTAPFGLLAAPQQFALWAQRHMAEYGTTSEQLGEVAIACRQHASLNPRALMQKPITMEDYLNSRMITSPFRLLDCCLETDGGAACVVTSLERARDLKQHPVRIVAGVCNAGGPATHEGRDSAEYTSMGSRYAAPLLWERAGLGPQDMDFGQIYDCFTFTVISQLEDLGFCGKGEGGPWVENGRIQMGGELPINTAGGHLSEGYVRSMNLVNEAVRQLRHDYEGTPRQVADANFGVVTSAPNPGSAIVLGRN
jgi:acetyl-CoA acetyltransferase